MYFDPQINFDEFRAYWARFMQIAPPGLWAKRKKRVTELIQRNPFAESYIAERFALERGIWEIQFLYEKTGQFPLISDYPHLAEAFAFVTTIAMVHQRLSTEGRRRLEGMLKDGIQDDIKGLAPLAYEMRIAIHLLSKGFSIQFADLEGIGRYDLLAANEDGSVEIEIECKHLTGDFARTVHSKKLVKLGGELISRLEEYKINFEGGRLIRLKLCKRLTNEVRQHNDLIDGIVSLLRGEESAIETATFSASLERFDAEQFYKLEDHLQKISRNKFTAAFLSYFDLKGENIGAWIPKKRFLVVNFSLTKPLVFIEAWTKQLRVALDGQFSGKLPSAICANLPGISDEDLKSIAAREAPNMNETTMLHRIANHAASKDRTGMLETIAFMSEGGVISNRRTLGNRISNVAQHGGTVYSFHPNNISRKPVDLFGQHLQSFSSSSLILPDGYR